MIGQVGIGVITPYDFALDRELWRWTPPQANLLITRLPYAPLEVTVEMVKLVGEPDSVLSATQELLVPKPAVMAYACTSGSFIRGVHGEKALCAAMIEAGAPVAVTTSGGILDAITSLGVERVAIATPYETAITQGLADFLSEAGRTVVAWSELGLTAGIESVPYDVTAELVRRADHPDAQAIVVSCTNLGTYDLIAPLEEELGKPLITANQATMWSALRFAGMPAIGPGQRLLEI